MYNKIRHKTRLSHKTTNIEFNQTKINNTEMMFDIFNYT